MSSQAWMHRTQKSGPALRAALSTDAEVTVTGISGYLVNEVWRWIPELGELCV